MASGKRTRIVGVVGACLAVSALLAACGDDDDAASDTTTAVVSGAAEATDVAAAVTTATPATERRHSAVSRSIPVRLGPDRRGQCAVGRVCAPVVAVNLLAWPREVLPLELATEVLHGGLDIARGALGAQARQSNATPHIHSSHLACVYAYTPPAKLPGEGGLSLHRSSESWRKTVTGRVSRTAHPTR